MQPDILKICMLAGLKGLKHVYIVTCIPHYSTL